MINRTDIENALKSATTRLQKRMEELGEAIGRLEAASDHRDLSVTGMFINAAHSYTDMALGVDAYETEYIAELGREVVKLRKAERREGVQS